MDMGKSAYDRFLDGDRSGMEEIVRQYNNCLIFFINGYVKNLAVAEDLAADTFCKLFVKKRRFYGDRNASFKTWLYTLARNAALDWLKRAENQRQVAISEVDGYHEPDFDDAILKNEQAKTLHTAMKSLNPQYCEVLHLVYFEELSYSMTAKVMKKSEKQIKNLIYRAKQALKTTLEKEDFVYENL